MLLSTEYYNYVNNVISVIQSLIINSVYTADSINAVLAQAGEPIPLDRSKWKYYLNLAGIPYVGITDVASDPSIQVFSLDTETLIPFTPSSLLANPETLADFQTLGTSYTNLLAQYPYRELFIRGVINPIPLEVSLSANDFDILYLDTSLLSPNETNVVSKLQNFINNFSENFNNRDYAFSDTHYPASFIGVMTSALVLELINIRLENCKTPYVHEWHVWNYLSGYFDLSKHKGIIPYNQALFLYRNMEYILANAGTRKILDFLNTGFCIPFNLFLSEFIVIKESITAFQNLNLGNYSSLEKDILVREVPYGKNVAATNSYITYTPAQFVTLISDTGIDNHLYLEHDTNELIRHGVGSSPNEIITGVLKADITNDVVVDLISSVDEAMIYWFYLVSIDKIKFKIPLDLNDVGVSNYLIDAKDAAIVYLFANLQLVQLNTNTIPEFWVKGIMLPPVLSESNIKGFVPNKSLTGNNYNLYDTLITNQTAPRNIYSLNEFNTFITDIVNSKFFHLILPTKESDFIVRSGVQFMVWSFYQNVKCSFCTETQFSEVFTRLNLNPTNWTTATYIEIITQISNHFIGIELETNTLQSPYSNMVDILEQITSYTITFVAGLSNNYNIPVFLWYPLGKVTASVLSTEFLVPILPNTVITSTTLHNSIDLQTESTSLDITNSIFETKSNIDMSIQTDETSILKTLSYVSNICPFTTIKI
jgi:hypothetical protein